MASTENVFQEARASSHFEAFDVDLHATNLEILLSILKVIKASCSTTHELVWSLSSELKKVNLEFVVIVIVAKCVGIDEHLSPFNLLSSLWLTLSLINWSVFARF